MAEHVARFFIRHSDVDIGPKGIATGGTTYGSNIAAAAAKAALFDVLTPDAFDRIDRLGQRMADGLQRSIDRCGLAWRILRNGPRIGYCMATEAPSTGPEAWASLDVDFIDTRRLYLANRGVWDAVVSAGPQASLAHTEADIDEYVRQATSFLEEMTGKIGS
jgi:glutamate-1-semialdehyde aminotransferase